MKLIYFSSCIGEHPFLERYQKKNKDQHRAGFELITSGVRSTAALNMQHYQRKIFRIHILFVSMSSYDLFKSARLKWKEKKNHQLAGFEPFTTGTQWSQGVRSTTVLQPLLLQWREFSSLKRPTVLMEEKSSERVMDGSPRIAFPPQDNETNIKIPPKGPTTDSKTNLDFNKFSQAFGFFRITAATGVLRLVCFCSSCF